MRHEVPPVNRVIKSMKQKGNPAALVRWNTDVKTIWLHNMRQEVPPVNRAKTGVKLLVAF